VTNAAGHEREIATIWVLLNDVNGRVFVGLHNLINGHARMTAPTINNHGDVIAFIHHTLAKNDPDANGDALVQLLSVFGETDKS
jgi:hypothetical protein